MICKTPFYKYAGCGNDFIIFDARERPLPPFSIKNLCHRQTGIGADGVIFIEKSDQSHARMRIFNADGSEAEMCGNGIRCLIHCLHKAGLSPAIFLIETARGVLKGRVEKSGEISVEMGEPSGMQWNLPFEIEGINLFAHFVDTGVPHTVVFSPAISKIQLEKWGPFMRHHPHFQPKGTNVNFAEQLGPQTFAIRTFERGVEAETYACGTGATAVALAAAFQYSLSSPLFIRTKSQETLTIHFLYQNNTFTNVVMTGPVQFIFQGSL